MKKLESPRLTIFTYAVPTRDIRLKKNFRPRKDGLIRLSINGSLDKLFYDTKSDTYILQLVTGKEIKFKDNLRPMEIEGYTFVYQYYEKYNHLEYIFRNDRLIYHGTLINIFENYSYIMGSLKFLGDGVIVDKPHVKVTGVTKFRYLYLHSYSGSIEAIFTNYINVEMKGIMFKNRHSPETILSFVNIPVEEIIDRKEVYNEFENLDGYINFWVNFYLKHPELSTNKYFPTFNPINKTLNELIKLILDDPNVIYRLLNSFYEEKIIWENIPGNVLQIIYDGDELKFKIADEILYRININKKLSSPIVATLNEEEFQFLMNCIHYSINFVNIPRIYSNYIRTFRTLKQIKTQIKEVKGYGQH